VRPDVNRWFQHRTTTGADWPLPDVLAAKGATTVSVVLPALDEENTVGDIVATIRRELIERAPLVDELVVIDSGSTDRTSTVAATAGARVVHRDSILPRLRPVRGKGEVLWRSLYAASGDVIAFVDADLRDFSASFVTGLLGPILSDPGVELVKGMYDRPLAAGERVLPAGGGRVTELVARPILNLHWPELSGFVQPLAGEYAARRRLLERLAFPCGYGVEIAMLVDTLELCGLDAMAQVDLGVRHHRHQDDASLGRMASEVWQAALERLERDGRLRRHTSLGTTLTQFERGTDDFRFVTSDVGCTERPPMITVPEYVSRQAGSPRGGRGERRVAASPTG
jgi:glucosyl-3-phosphoglycerate synthase